MTITNKWSKAFALCAILIVSSFVPATSRSQDSSRTATSNKSNDKIPSGIAWYGVLKDGLAEAEASNRPILLLSAAPQCAGIPGMW